MKEKLKAVVPSLLKGKNLQLNESKMEEYEIKRGGEEKWKKCKYLGSLLDTEEDIQRRTDGDAYNQLRHILESNRGGARGGLGGYSPRWSMLAPVGR